MYISATSAVRDDKGAYLGTLEVTQNIAEIPENSSGDKRLLERLNCDPVAEGSHRASGGFFMSSCAQSNQSNPCSWERSVANFGNVRTG